MTKTEVKKALYKQKPIAKYITNIGELAVYKTSVNHADGYDYSIRFYIPIKELFDTEGNRIISEEESAQLLIRWLI